MEGQGKLFDLCVSQNMTREGVGMWCYTKRVRKERKDEGEKERNKQRRKDGKEGRTKEKDRKQREGEGEEKEEGRRQGGGRVGGFKATKFFLSSLWLGVISPGSHLSSQKSRVVTAAAASDENTDHPTAETPSSFWQVWRCQGSIRMKPPQTTNCEK